MIFLLFDRSPYGAGTSPRLLANSKVKREVFKSIREVFEDCSLRFVARWGLDWIGVIINKLCLDYYTCMYLLAATEVVIWSFSQQVVSQKDCLDQ
jgi:hypothetical protein